MSRHVLLRPHRLAVLQQVQHGQVLGDEGVNGGKINKQAYTFLVYAGFYSLTRSLGPVLRSWAEEMTTA